jgi:hypothetical protein
MGLQLSAGLLRMRSSIGLSKIVGAQTGKWMDTFLLKEKIICAELITIIFSFICKNASFIFLSP